MFPTPKYQVGDVVWTASVDDVSVPAVCPDCNGSHKWTAISPAGEEFEFPCPRCQGHDAYKLAHRKAVFTVRRLTIGSIEINTLDTECPVSYMCLETGVGSGTVWREDCLAPDEAGAADIGRIKVAEREVWRASEIARMEHNQGAAGTAQRVEVALRYHSFQTAAIVRAQSKARDAGFKLENLCNAIAELDGYGGIEGLDTPTLDRIIKCLSEDHAMVGECRDAVMTDREKQRKAS